MPLLKQVVEALVFASQKPLVPREIAAALKAAAEDAEDPALSAMAKTREAEIGAALEEIKAEFEDSDRAFRLVEQVNGWHFVTSSAYAPWVRQLFPESKPVRLSGPALETLAIIAYRQPITRADIEAVRGVAVDGMVNMLLERGLIRIAGRADVPGRPLLYESTEYFLQHFGLKTLDELPNSSELRRIPLPVAATPPAEPAPEAAPATPGAEQPDAESPAADSAPTADSAPAGPIAEPPADTAADAPPPSPPAE
ncbi:MAG TPA: SMC-Scp complex subunit ScpB [Chthoniobacteraceae bacterium]|jgi:segregation and condensation protein B|nr:SMC-Scp complex subunit ScpB [Chthoniobacteraceae bacterium]